VRSHRDDKIVAFREVAVRLRLRQLQHEPRHSLLFARRLLSEAQAPKSAFFTSALGVFLDDCISQINVDTRRVIDFTQAAVELACARHANEKRPLLLFKCREINDGKPLSGKDNERGAVFSLGSFPRWCVSVFGQIHDRAGDERLRAELTEANASDRRGVHLYDRWQFGVELGAGEVEHQA
jgi:hypothetical protein